MTLTIVPGSVVEELLASSREVPVIRGREAVADKARDSDDFRTGVTR